MDSDAPLPLPADEPGEDPAAAASSEPVDQPQPGLVERLPGWTAPALLLGIPFLVWIGTLISPRQVYDNFVWKYYWGPIKADGQSVSHLVHNGVTAYPGYNMVNTLSWVVLMAICILGLYQMLRHFEVKMDAKAVYGATAWVVAGAIAHVLQDTDLILAPLEYVFITPPIYLLYAAGGIISLLIGIYLGRVAEAAGLERAFQKLWMIFAAGTLLWLLLWIYEWQTVRLLIHPVIVAVVAAATFFAIRIMVERKGSIGKTDLITPFALAFIAFDLVYVATYIQNPWPGRTPGDGLPITVIAAPAIAAAMTGVIWLIARNRYKLNGSEVAAAFTNPVNLLLIFSQSVDGVATAYGLDLAGYHEKHVLSGFIIDKFQEISQNIGWEFGATYPTFLAFAPLKLLVSVLVVYTIDIYSKEEVKQYPNLIGLVKFAIIMVGIGPGVRNFVRLGLGV